MLTTFVAACAGSSLTQLAQRARKILQEEGTHRVHAVAWARRLCRAGGRERDGLVARLRATWEEAGRWTGPDDDPGFRAAMASGMVAQSPAQQRELMRSWLVALLAAAQPLRPRLAVDAVRALLLEDLLRAGSARTTIPPTRPPWRPARSGRPPPTSAS